MERRRWSADIDRQRGKQNDGSSANENRSDRDSTYYGAPTDQSMCRTGRTMRTPDEWEDLKKKRPVATKLDDISESLGSGGEKGSRRRRDEGHCSTSSESHVRQGGTERERVRGEERRHDTYHSRDQHHTSLMYIYYSCGDMDLQKASVRIRTCMLLYESSEHELNSCE